VGRPRTTGPAKSGSTTSEEILAAAATLFCSQGYGGTSTHAIAQLAGISQGNVHHHFASKDAILHELLLRTVRPSVEFATQLIHDTTDAAERLWALCAYDAQLLMASPSNTGTLYLLPETAGERFAQYHAERNRLRSDYRTLVSDSGRVTNDHIDAVTGMVYALVESVILRRRNEPDLHGPQVVIQTGDAALLLIGTERHELPVIRTRAQQRWGITPGL
jgi:AcrR family transcriptional regulator